MNEMDENVIIKNALLDAATKEFAEELSTCEPITVSIRFQRQMRIMKTNPNSWARRRRKPVWKQFMQAVAMILLVGSVMIGTIVAASPTARAMIVEWVTEWYENSVIYRFFGEPVFEDLPQYKITNLPTGYYDTRAPLKLPNNTEITYENSLGEVIKFEYMRIEEGSAIVMDTENMLISEIEINKCFGHLYVSQDPQQSNCITWYDNLEGIQFVIDGFFDGEELASMAKSVALDD